ncbi:MAG: LysE family translocator [Pseudomonadota bacterium]
MELSVWLALVALFFTGGLTPGPAVMLVVSGALKYGARPALISAIGVSTANLLWLVLAALGAGVVAARFPDAFLILKLCGVAFIAWLAWRMAFSGRAIDLASGEAPRRSALFARGVGLQLANPNALVFFGGLLPAFIDADGDLPTQIAVIAMTITITEMIGLSVYAWGAEALAARFRSPQFARAFSRAAAVLMAGSALLAVALTS